MKRNAIYPLVFLIILLIGLTPIKSFGYSISTCKVKLINEPSYEYIPAEVVSKTAVTISSKITGFVEGLKVDIGDRVKKGEILLSIDQNVSRQNVKQAMANVAKAKAQLKNARFNYRKFLSLYKKKAVSKQQFLNMKTNYKTAIGAYEQALAGLKVAKSTLRYSVIKSPINGVVSAKYVNNGDIASMFQPLISISRLKNLQVVANIDEKTLQSIKSLKFVKVKIQKDVFFLKVSNISPKLDSISRTLEIKIDLPRTAKVRPGKFAYVIVATSPKPTIVVNKDAKTVRGGVEGVFVIDNKGRANFRMVRFGKTVGKYIEVLSGLFPKETVILNPPLSLKNESIIVNEKQ